MKKKDGTVVKEHLKSTPNFPEDNKKKEIS